MADFLVFLSRKLSKTERQILDAKGLWLSCREHDERAGAPQGNRASEKQMCGALEVWPGGWRV